MDATLKQEGQTEALIFNWERLRFSPTYVKAKTSPSNRVVHSSMHSSRSDIPKSICTFRFRFRFRARIRFTSSHFSLVRQSYSGFNLVHGEFDRMKVRFLSNRMRIGEQGTIDTELTNGTHCFSNSTLNDESWLKVRSLVCSFVSLRFALRSRLKVAWLREHTRDTVHQFEHRSDAGAVFELRDKLGDLLSTRNNFQCSFSLLRLARSRCLTNQAIAHVI